MDQPDFSHRLAEAAAGRELPVHVTPAEREFRAPAQATTTAVIGGVRLAPAARLSALAAVRDQHRAQARAASDKMHNHREALERARRRLELLKVHDTDMPHIASQVAAVEAEVEALTAARGAALAEAESASAAAGQASQLLRSCLALCATNGIVAPVLLATEVQNA